MDFKIVISIEIFLFLIAVLGLVYYIIKYVYKPYLEKINRLREYDLYMNFDPELAEKEIDKLIDKYLNKYVLENVIVKKIDYLQEPQVNIMISTLTHDICLDITELYIFYIKNICNINDDNDLIKYIRNKVKEHVLDFINDFNNTTS